MNTSTTFESPRKTVEILLVLSFVFCVTSSDAVAQRPNVVILFADDQGTLDANCYGSTDLMTPNIDRIAQDGVRFTQAYAHTVCCPSRAALLTGRHPQRCGVNSWMQGDRHGSDSQLANMHQSELTIAEVLKKAGYDTALFGKWHLGAKEGHDPLSQGFDRFFGHLSGFIDNYRHCFLHGRGYHDLYDDLQEIHRRDEYFPEMMMKQALGYLDDRVEDPFFMMVAFNLPHYPEQPIGKYADAYKDLEMPRQSYARVVSTVDHFIGRIHAKLEDKGFLENTILIVMSDNGHSVETNRGISVDNHISGYPKGHYYLANGGGGNTGKWIGAKGKFLEGGVRVPAIVSWPAKLPKGIVRDQAVTIMDWYPTVLQWCGIDIPDVKLDGRSLQPVIESAENPSSHPVICFQWQSKWAVREGDWKLIKQGAARTLHNLADQEPEKKDYFDEKPDIANALQARYDAWASDVFAGNSPKARPKKR